MKKKRIIIVVLLIAMVITVVVVFNNRSNSGAAPVNEAYSEATPMRQDIKTSLSGNGSLEPADSYTVSSMVTGEVLQADFEEGEIVEKDSLLYVIDSSALTNGIDQSRMTLEQNQDRHQRNLKSLEDLKIESGIEGTIIDINVEVDDMVNAGQVIATIRDQEILTIKVPFIASEAEQVALGSQAIITLSNNYETITGRVTKVASVAGVTNANVMTKEVTIEVPNPGALIAGMEGYAQIGNYAGTGSGSFEWKKEGSVMALSSGKVSKILITEGEKVTSGQLLVLLTNDTLSNAIVDSDYAIKSAQMSLDKQLEALDDYEVRSPIAGTIVEKSVKIGDTLSQVNTLCTIFDMSYLTTVLNIDELDIDQVELGSSVEITVEALEDKVYEGIITRININGSTMNGVTTYPVTVRIDMTEGLMPGMNATFNVIVAERENALVIPIAAIERGNQVLVYTGVEKLDESSDIPSGYEYVTVTTGISDDSYVEILSGIDGNDKILVKEVVLSTDNVRFGPGGNDGGGF